MPTTAQLIADDYAYWCPLVRWNGTDAPGTGTAAGVDYALYRNCGGRSAANITQFNGNSPGNPTNYVASGAYSAQNQLFDASATKHNPDGSRMQWFPEYQRPAGQAILCALTYANPVMPVGDPHAGKTMLDSALICALWPLNYVNKDWAPNGDGTYSQVTVPSTDPNYRGLPTLSNFGNGTHTCTFWLKEVLHALVLLLQSSYANTVSPQFGVTYSQLIANNLPALLGVAQWLLYGGSASYVIPNAPNGDGSWTGGTKQASDDAQDAGLTHRRACEAVTYILLWWLRGQTDADLLWWADNYAGITLDAQAPDGYFPENKRSGVAGLDTNYNQTTLNALRNCFILWPQSGAPSVGQTALRIALNTGVTWQATRVFTAPGFDPNGVPIVVGMLHEEDDSRVNGFVPLLGPGAGQVTGFPVVPGPGGTWVYTGEGEQGAGDSGIFIPKEPSYAEGLEALNAWGYFTQILTGTDAAGWQPLGTSVMVTSAWAAAGPLIVAPVTPILPSVPRPPSYLGYPVGSDVEAFVAGLGVTIPEGLDFDGAAAAAASEFEQRTGWQPFLAGPQFTRYFDPPGFGPTTGRGSSVRGGRTLELNGGLLDMPDNGLLIGYVPNTLYQAGVGQIGGTGLTASSGSPGTILTRGLNYYLKPDNAPARGLAWTSIELLSPSRGLPQSISITGVWGRVRSVPADVFRAIVQKAAAELAPQIGLSVSGGMYRRKIGDSDKTFGGTGAPSPLAYEAGTWETQFTKTAQRWKRVTV